MKFDYDFLKYCYKKFEVPFTAESESKLESSEEIGFKSERVHVDKTGVERKYIIEVLLCKTDLETSQKFRIAISFVDFTMAEFEHITSDIKPDVMRDVNFYTDTVEGKDVPMLLIVGTLCNSDDNETKFNAISNKTDYWFNKLKFNI